MYWKMIVGLCAVLCIMTNVYGQTVDSLRLNISNASTDTARIKAVAELAKAIATKDSQENRKLHQRILREIDSLLALESDEQTVQFLKYYQAESQIQIGINFYLDGQLARALDYEVRALSNHEALGNGARQAMACIVIGAIHSEQGSIAAALPFHRKAYALNQLDSNTNGMALALNNLGIAHLDLDSVELAESEFLQSLALYEEIGNKRGMGVELLNLGSVYKTKGQVRSAVGYFKRSLEIREEIGDLQGQIFSHARLGQLYLSVGNLIDAEIHGKASLRLANEKGYPRGIRDAMELLADLYEQKGNYKQALKYQKDFITYRDSLADQEKVRDVARAESRFQYEQELLADSLMFAEEQNRLEAEIAVGQAEASEQRATSRLLWIGLAFALILGLLIADRYRRSRKQEKIIQRQKEEVEVVAEELARGNEEKELLLKEIHHRVKNNLQVISSLLDLQTKGLEDEQALTAISDGQNRVKAMALIHEKLYQNEDLAQLDFTAYVRQLLAQIASLFPKGKEVKTAVTGVEVKLDIDTSIPLGLILNELLTNAFKYGVAGQENGEIAVDVQALTDGEYALQVRDNGPGMPEGFVLKKAKSLGLRLVRRLSVQLYGSATFENDAGAVFTVRFKDTAARKAVE